MQWNAGCRHESMFDSSLSADPLYDPTLLRQRAGHGERGVNMPPRSACRNQGAMPIVTH
jgi:hypothetical protein